MVKQELNILGECRVTAGSEPNNGPVSRAETKVHKTLSLLDLSALSELTRYMNCNVY